MRTLRRNKQKLYYALQTGEKPVYVYDENGNIVYDHYTDSDGNIIYYLDEEGEKIPLTTGETELGYTLPTPFFANIGFSSGEVDNLPFGTDISSYDATLVMNNGELPIDENSLLWFETEPQYKDDDKTVIDPFSADFKVLGIIPSLNSVTYILGRLTK